MSQLTIKHTNTINDVSFTEYFGKSRTRTHCEISQTNIFLFTVTGSLPPNFLHGLSLPPLLSSRYFFPQSYLPQVFSPPSLPPLSFLTQFFSPLDIQTPGFFNPCLFQPGIFSESFLPRYFTTQCYPPRSFFN